MAISLNQIYQERIFLSFKSFLYGMSQKPPDDATRLQQIKDSRITLQLRVNEQVLQGLHLQEAMLEYLRIREHEEALHFHATPVPNELVAYFQNITYPVLQDIVNRLAFFPSLSASSDQRSPSGSDKTIPVKETISPIRIPETHLTPVTLGTDINSSQSVTLEQNHRQGGLYVIGKTRSGKTTLLVNLILQDIEQGTGVCFIDPHGDAINDILARLPSHREQDVILLDPFNQ